MRKALVLLTVLSLAGSLWAADPFAGTWKLNVAKSKMPPIAEQALKEETSVVQEVGDYFVISSIGIYMDGSRFSNKYKVPLQGGAIELQEGALPEGAYIIKARIDANNVYTIRLLNGKQVSVMHSVVSKDGKTIRNTTKGIDAQGKPFERVTVFDKQ